MSPPPPHPDDRPPPPPGRDPLLDDPLFAEIVEEKPLPDLKLERESPPPLPVAEPVEVIPVAEEVEIERAAPVAMPVRRPTEPPRSVPPPPRRPEEPTEAPRPRPLAACAVLGCFGLGLFGAIAFLGYAAIVLLSGVANPNRPAPSTAVSRPEPVAPTTLMADKATIVLPGYVDAVGRAAGGRYLLLWVSRANQVLVFDPNTGQLGKPFDIGAPDALIAGSASKLFVYRPNAAGAELERWNLETREKELTAAKPPGLPRLDAIATGAGADGPLFLIGVPTNGNATVRLVDPNTLESDTNFYKLGAWKGGARTHVRASDDGALLGVTTAGGAALVRLPAKANPTLTVLPGALGRPPLLATPSRDGLWVFTPNGVYETAGVKRVSDGNPYSFPAAHGSGLFLSIDRKGGVFKALDQTVRLHPVTDPDQSVVLAGVEAPTGLQDLDIGDVPPDQRVHLWPAAGLAAVLRSQPGGQQQLDVRKVDVPKLLQESEKSYLLFGSEPRLWAVRGREWRYRPVVWTDARVTPAPTKAEGPREMTVRNGDVLWTPGPNVTSAEVVLRVATGDATAEQRFRVTVIDAVEDDDD